MTVEEYQRYFAFCSEMGKTPYSYNYIKNAKLQKMMSLTKEKLNKYDLKYIQYMNKGINQYGGINKYMEKKYGNVNLKIK